MVRTEWLLDNPHKIRYIEELKEVAKYLGIGQSDSDDDFISALYIIEGEEQRNHDFIQSKKGKETIRDLIKSHPKYKFWRAKREAQEQYKALPFSKKIQFQLLVFYHWAVKAPRAIKTELKEFYYLFKGEVKDWFAYKSRLDALSQEFKEFREKTAWMENDLQKIKERQERRKKRPSISRDGVYRPKTKKKKTIIASFFNRPNSY